MGAEYTNEKFGVEIDVEIYKGILSHARKYKKEEVIGKLVGKPFKYPRAQYCYIDIWGYVPVSSISTPVSVRYSPEAAEHLGEDLLVDYDDSLVVGWYHSHPGMGCFLSDQDIETQLKNYPEWYHCALVVDPSCNEFKFFRIEGDYLREVEYYIYRKK